MQCLYLDALITGNIDNCMLLLVVCPSIWCTEWGEPTMVHVRSGKACSRVAPWTFQRAFAETSNKTIQNHPQIRALNSRDSFWCSVVQFSTHSQGLQLPSGRCQAPDPRRPDQWNVDFFASLWHDSCPVFAHKLLKLLKSEPLDHGMTMGGWFHTLTCSGSHGTYPVATSPYYSRPYSILMDFWTTNQRGAGAASESLSAKRESCTSSKQRHTLPSEREKAMENHHFWWENSLFLWPFSIAMLNYQRVDQMMSTPQDFLLM